VRCWKYKAYIKSGGKISGTKKQRNKKAAKQKSSETKKQRYKKAAKQNSNKRSSETK
jgi:hypothetical protein